MKPTSIKYGKEARQALAQGADKLAKAVVSTLGPQSRNGAIQNYPAPLVVHDGVTIARVIKLEDPFEDMGAQLIKEAATKTNSEGGDGTTTSTLLANTLIQNGLKLIEGVDDGTLIRNTVKPMTLKDRLISYSDEICAKLDVMARPVKDGVEIENVARISAGNEAIGKIVADAIQEIGNGGLVMVEDSDTNEDQIDVQEGFEWNNGYMSPYFATDPIKMVASYDDAYVLITDQTIANAMDLTPLLTEIYESGGPKKPLLIVAGDVIGGAFRGLVTTRNKLDYPVLCVIAPDFAERRKQSLEDLAVLLGGVVISEEAGMMIKDVKIGQLGRARNIYVSQYTTQVTPLNPDHEEIDLRVKEIKEQIKDEDNNFRRQRLEERLARLGQKVAIIRVGGGSKTEIGERRERFIDAIGATRAAIEQGIVPGGGIALLNVASDYKVPVSSPSSDLVLKLVIDMLEAPFNTLLDNAGLDSRDENLLRIKSTDGVDVMSESIVDMFEAGIIDPVKVTKSAVKNAMSVAAMVLTNDVLITEKNDDLSMFRDVLIKFIQNK